MYIGSYDVPEDVGREEEYGSFVCVFLWAERVRVRTTGRRTLTQWSDHQDVRSSGLCFGIKSLRWSAGPLVRWSAGQLVR